MNFNNPVLSLETFEAQRQNRGILERLNSFREFSDYYHQGSLEKVAGQKQGSDIEISMASNMVGETKREKDCILKQEGFGTSQDQQSIIILSSDEDSDNECKSVGLT